MIDRKLLIFDKDGLKRWVSWNERTNKYGGHLLLKDEIEIEFIINISDEFFKEKKVDFKIIMEEIKSENI